MDIWKDTQEFFYALALMVQARRFPAGVPAAASALGVLLPARLGLVVWNSLRSCGELYLPPEDTGRVSWTAVSWLGGRRSHESPTSERLGMRIKI